MELPDAFSTANNISIVGQDSSRANDNSMLYRVLYICLREVMKLNKYKFHFRCTSVRFLVKLFLDRE